MKRSIPFLLLAAAPAFAAEQQKTVEQRLDALEFASYANTVSWSGYFESRVDQLTYKSKGKEDEKLPMHRMLAGIDLKATPNEKFSVFGRIAFAKFYNNQNSTVPVNSSLSSSRRYGDDGKAYVERFFVNYTPTSWFAFSLGRLPTMDGPPRHILDGRPRLASYPQQVYASALDGYALTFTPSIGDGQQLAIRYVLSPFHNYIAAGSTDTTDQFYVPNTYTGSTATYRKVRDLNSWMIDYSTTSLGFVRELSAIYQGVQLNKIDVTPTLDFTMTKHMLYAEFNDIAHIGLTAYASYATSTIKSDGSQIVGVNPVTGQPIAVSILANEADAKKSGNGTIVGLSYQLPLAAANNPSIGADYVKGSQFWTNFDFSSNEAFGYYDIRGTGNQFYYLQPITTGLSLRIGIQQAKADYSAALFGEPTKSEDKYNNIYANLRADF